MKGNLRYGACPSETPTGIPVEKKECISTSAAAGAKSPVGAPLLSTAASACWDCLGPRLRVQFYPLWRKSVWSADNSGDVHSVSLSHSAGDLARLAFFLSRASFYLSTHVGNTPVSIACLTDRCSPSRSFFVSAERIEQLQA
jgi:hypothetical protein